MVTPNRYITTDEKIIASYDWTDIAEGTGIVGFWGLKLRDATGEVYRINENAFYSSAIETTEAGSFTNDAVSVWTATARNFDLGPFNFPKTIKGKAIVVIYWKNMLSTNTDGTLTAGIYKYSNSTETLLGSTSHTSANLGAAYLDVLEIALTQTNFKRGDVLRLKISYVTGVRGGGGTTTCSLTFGHDPLNRDGVVIIPSGDPNNITTQLKFYCPFKIDL